MRALLVITIVALAPPAFADEDPPIMVPPPIPDRAPPPGQPPPMSEPPPSEPAPRSFAAIPVAVMTDWHFVWRVHDDTGFAPIATHARRWAEVTVGFTRTSMDGAPNGSNAEGTLIDLAGHLRVRGGLVLGVGLELAPWRNWETAFEAQTNYLTTALALARYEREGGDLHPFVQVGLGGGVSSIAPRFTIFEPRANHRPWGTTIDDDRTGAAAIAQAAIGLRQDLAAHVFFVCHVSVQRALMWHHMVFEEEDGPTTTTDRLGLDQIAVRFGMGVTF
jgi:hypothetical protein